MFLSPDERKILTLLNNLEGRNVLLALPGAKNPLYDPDTGQEIPDSFMSPLLPDLAPICSGLTGIYSYAGHWSETPDYYKKAGEMSRFFFKEPFKGLRQVMSDSERQAFIADTGATYALLPSPEILNGLPLVDPSQLGHVVYNGSQFRLIKLTAR